MQRKFFHAVLPAAILTLTFGFALPVLPAKAQGPMMGMGGGARILNPANNAFGTLLQRDDVKSEIPISQKENELLTAEQDKGMQQMQSKIRENLPDFQAMGSLPEEERKSKFDEMRTKIQEVAQTSLTSMSQDMEKKAIEVLSPAKLKRLHELDLQWRGPLALADKKVAEPMKITPDQKPKIAALLADYQKQQQEMMQGIYSGFAAGFANGTPPTQEEIQARREEMKTKMTKAQEKIEEIRKAENVKVLALLTDEQKAAWTTALGKPFKFRKTEQ